jgi:hypothetical protein
MPLLQDRGKPPRFLSIFVAGFGAGKGRAYSTNSMRFAIVEMACAHSNPHGSIDQGGFDGGERVAGAIRKDAKKKDRSAAMIAG